VSKSILQGVFSTTASVFLNTYLGIQCRGLERIPDTGPYILAANHCSHLDTVAIREVLGRRAAALHVMGARDYFFDRGWKRMVLPRALPIIPFDRERDFLEGLRLCREAIAQGRSLLIFPEGKRTRTGELLPFHPGPAILALTQRVPVLPLYIQGTADVLPPGTKYSRPAPVRVRIGEQIWFEEGTGVAEAKKAMEDAMAALDRRQAQPVVVVPAFKELFEPAESHSVGARR